MPGSSGWPNEKRPRTRLERPAPAAPHLPSLTIRLKVKLRVGPFAALAATCSAAFTSSPMSCISVEMPSAVARFGSVAAWAMASEICEGVGIEDKSAVRGSSRVPRQPWRDARSIPQTTDRSSDRSGQTGEIVQVVTPVALGPKGDYLGAAVGACSPFASGGLGLAAMPCFSRMALSCAMYTRRMLNDSICHPPAG
jgi:hypothetical protein